MNWVSFVSTALLERDGDGLLGRNRLTIPMAKVRNPKPSKTPV